MRPGLDDYLGGPNACQDQTPQDPVAQQLGALLIPIATLFLGAVRVVAAEPASSRISIDVNKPGIHISPTLFGIFFEEINCAGDGGIYPELVRNRSFEDSDKPDHWALVTSGAAKGDMAMDAGWPVGEYNRRGLKLTIAPGGEGRVGIANKGWYGMGIKQGEDYLLSFNAKAGGGWNGILTASLECDGHATTLATAHIDGVGHQWKRHTAILKAKANHGKAELVLSATTPGSL